MTKLRIRCLVPHCTHTRGPRKGDTYPIHADTEWICAKHWKALPRKMRQVHGRAWNWFHDLPYRRKGAPEMRRNRVAARRLWERVKRAAIERGMGI